VGDHDRSRPHRRIDDLQRGAGVARDPRGPHLAEGGEALGDAVPVGRRAPQAVDADDLAGDGRAAGLSLCTLFFMLFSLPASGGAIGPEFVPAFYHSVARILPGHAALQALKGVVYFEGGGVLGPVLILLAWIVAALLAHLATHLVRRSAPHPPVLGATPQLPAAAR
jgi:hypothetical protein